MEASNGLINEKCISDMFVGGQIEPSDSQWSTLVILVTKKMKAPHYVLTTAL